MFRNFRKKDLATLLEERADQLEKIYSRNVSDSGFAKLSEQDSSKLKAILSSTTIDGHVETLIDGEIRRLEKAGMRTNTQTKEVTNIFAEYQAAPGETEERFDGSVFNPTDHFGKVIKEAYLLKLDQDPDTLSEDQKVIVKLGIIGSVRYQACLRQLQRYEKANPPTMQPGAEKDGKEKTKEVQSDTPEDKINRNPMDNLILLRAQQQMAFLGGASVLRDLQYISNPSYVTANLMEQIQVTAASQLANVISQLRVQAKVVRKIKNANHLMSAKEFQSATSVWGAVRPPDLKKIDSELHILHGTSPSFFWKKQISPKLNDHERLTRLTLLLEQIKLAEQKAGVQYSEQRKAGLTQLRAQVEYAIFQTGSTVKPEQSLTANLDTLIAGFQKGKGSLS